jgi:hypothetical protein
LSRDVIDLRQTLHEFRPQWLGASSRPRLAILILAVMPGATPGIDDN